MHRPLIHRRVLRLAVVGALLVLLAAPASAKGSLQDIEKEFRAAIEKVAPATVICVTADVGKNQRAHSASGVIVSKDGHVLTEGNVGAAHVVQGRQITSTT